MTQATRRMFVGTIAGATLLALAPLAAHAQAYPNKPIRLIVPYATGSTTDSLSRLIGQKMSESMGQQVIADNRPGAGGTLGTDIAAKAAPDGYTLVVVPGSHTINPSMYKSLPYDSIKDFTPIAMFGSAPLLLAAHPSLAANNPRELIALAKSKPGALNYASGGIGSPSHISMELLNSMAGIKLVHVPYKGGGQVMTAVLSNEVQMTPGGMIGLLPHIKSGKLKAIAVTSSKRSSALPDVPTIAEGGVAGYNAAGWWGLLAPANTPMAIVNRLHSEVDKAIKSADISGRFKRDGIEPGNMSPAEFAAHIRDETQVMAKVIKDAGIKAE